MGIHIITIMQLVTRTILYDTRIVVTATIPTEVTTVTEVTEATVQETTTIQNAEIKNLSTIKIGFRYSF